MWLSLTWCARSCEQMKVKVKAPVVRLVGLTHLVILVKAQRELETGLQEERADKGK